MMNSKAVDNNVVQDVSIPLVIIGTDVVSLYPNLKWDPAGEQVYQAIMETDIKFEGINYKEGVRYLALVRGFDWCKASSLRRVLPERRFAKGGWPGITGAGPLGPGVNDEDQWDFPIVELTDKEKKMIIGEIMRMSVEVLFKTHCYSFKGSTFRQSDGGPIGLRGTCAIARVVMARHSIMWAKLIEANNINTSFIGFYVDGGRIIMYSLRPGWRWFNGGLWYREDWEQEDKFLSPTERTKNMISRTLGDIVDCLEFTVETPEDYPDNWLPTLDISMHMNSENQLQYRFFEKPTASKLCLQADTALSQNCLVQSLVQDIIRRMLNCSSHTDIETRCQIIDKFAQKMLNSGHQLTETRKHIVSGLKGWKNKIRRCQNQGKPIHRTAKESSGSRRIKKLLGKATWFLDNKPRDDEDEIYPIQPEGIIPTSNPSGRTSSNSKFTITPKDAGSNKSSNNIPKTTSVLFVEQSKGGSLAAVLRKKIECLAPMLGYRFRVVESAGTKLSDIFSNKKIWQRNACGRKHCHPCRQESEKKEDCSTENILYESRCKECNGKEKGKEEGDLRDSRKEPSIYVGESSRSLMERSKEHHDDYKKNKEESHMSKHWANSHPGPEKPNFHQYIIGTFKSSLERQVAEAV